ncbi:unnamed protein product [Rodentolepis nana]|uniref:Uncharacterized protein n=1 Tax=Rodentolepis nana TaxID=102285 RepID=A0A0R3TTG7_RODNA|nr:unnamed protein product [Rodentolepis nana]
MFGGPMDWSKILQHLQQNNLTQLNGNTTNEQQPQQHLFNPIQHFTSDQPINPNQGTTGEGASNGHPMPPADRSSLPLPQPNLGWYVTRPPLAYTFQRNEGATETINLDELIDPSSPDTLRRLPTPPPAHIGCCVKPPPQHSTQAPDIPPPRAKEHPPLGPCPFNNFPHGTGILPGVVPSTERDLAYAREQHYMSNVPWFPLPPPAHSTPHHPPILNFFPLRGPPPSAHSGPPADF